MLKANYIFKSGYFQNALKSPYSIKLFLEDEFVTLIGSTSPQNTLFYFANYNFYINKQFSFGKILFEILAPLTNSNFDLSQLKAITIPSIFLISKKPAEFAEAKKYISNEFELIGEQNNGFSNLVEELDAERILASLVEKNSLETLEQFCAYDGLNSHIKTIYNSRPFLKDKTQLIIYFYQKNCIVYLFKEGRICFTNSYSANDYVNLAYQVLNIKTTFKLSEEVELICLGQGEEWAQFNELLKENFKSISFSFSGQLPSVPPAWDHSLFDSAKLAAYFI
ncbi:MAG: DUF3822 family protein [Sediminibacterium sp.]|nr:DUF3822 family protein [Sediminibacterium sp.]